MAIKLGKNVPIALVFVIASALFGARNIQAAAPTIGTIANQTVIEDQPTHAIQLVLTDDSTPELSLQPTGVSDNQSVVPNANIFFGTANGHWYTTVTPAFGKKSGTAKITITISDGSAQTSTNFILTVNPPPVRGARFYNPAPITIPDVGSAATYPSVINVAGRSGTITNMTITLSKLSHERVQELNMMLVGPATNMVILSHVSNGDRSATNVTVHLSDDTTYPLPINYALWSEPLWPTAYEPVASFAAPAPAPGPYGTNHFNSTFNGTNPNGVWALYINDDTAGFSSVISGGWSLMIETTGGGSLPPEISDIANQSVVKNTNTGPISFTVNDDDTASGSLTLGKNSSNPALVPLSGIVFGGSGTSRTVTITPATNQTGTATITVSVTDGTTTNSDSFVLTVFVQPTMVRVETAVDGSGTVVPAQTVNPGDSITVYAIARDASSNFVANLAADSWSLANVTGSVVSGDLVQAADKKSATFTGHSAGSAKIHVTLGSVTPTDSGVLTVLPGGAFANAAEIAMPNLGAGSLYPSTISASGLNGAVSNVIVTLRGVSHAWGDDIDVLLVGPGGQKVKVMSDAGTGPINNANLTFSDGAASMLPQTGSLVSGTYKPTDYPPANTYPAPAPAGPYGTNLSGFKGQSANGTWSLYVMDDGINDAGSITAGWTLTIVTMPGAPTISDIANEFTTTNTPTAAIPFTVGDPDTALASLTLSGGSSNTNLVTANNIVFGGSGSNRTVTVTPTDGQTGTATITVTVSDGALSANDTFLLTVNLVNTAPTISGIANQVVNEDTPTAALAFTVGDAQTSAGSLTLGKASSNQTLVPTNNIVFGGSGANRTVTVTPAANQNGAATITVRVSDGQFTVSSNFLVTVTAVNDAPTITPIANQAISINGTTGPLSFTIGDAETAAGSLTLKGYSSNTNLVATNSIVFGGSASNRTVTVTPAAGASGTATITLSVSDGTRSTSNSFALTMSFINGAAITIPDSGQASPYPSTIIVSGLGGVITNVTVSLSELSHTWKADIDVLLVSPGGQKVLLMSDAGAAFTPSNSVTLTFSDSAAAFLPSTNELATGTFKPTDYINGPLDMFDAPAPAGPYGTNLSGFNGQSANGTWSLYVMDDGTGDEGIIATGWSLAVTTDGPAFSVGLPLQITGLAFDGDTIRVTVSGQAGVSYALQASGDQFQWSPVDVQNNVTGSVVLSEQRTTNSVRFYRAVSVP